MIEISASAKTSSVTARVDISAADVSPATVTFTNSTRNYTLTGSQAIAGATGIAKTGSGTVTLGTANTFSGAVAIGAGTLQTASGMMVFGEIYTAG